MTDDAISISSQGDAPIGFKYGRQMVLGTTALAGVQTALLGLVLSTFLFSGAISHQSPLELTLATIASSGLVLVFPLVTGHGVMKLWNWDLYQDGIIRVDEAIRSSDALGQITFDPRFSPAEKGILFALNKAVKTSDNRIAFSREAAIAHFPNHPQSTWTKHL